MSINRFTNTQENVPGIRFEDYVCVNEYNIHYDMFIWLRSSRVLYGFEYDT
jgi:hypothetical protein